MIKELAPIRVISKVNTFPLSRKRPENTLNIKVHNRATSIGCKQILKDLRASPDNVIERCVFRTDQSNALRNALCKIVLEANTYFLQYGVIQ